MNAIDQPCALLGGLSPADFMRHYWQKKPLLIRGAMPGFKAPITRNALFALAQRDEVESRLVVQSGAKNRARSWSLTRGPFARRSLPPLAQKAWSLLVQGVNLYEPKAHEILEQFNFIPRVRLDDLMISYASDGGGVGPHFDSYDVFLLQAQGVRRWRIAKNVDNSLLRGAALKILARFKHEQEWDLAPGDMLYLPPSYAHEGVAKGECMTYSIGFTSPRGSSLAKALMGWMAEESEDSEGSEGSEGPPSVKRKASIYADPNQAATQSPGEIPVALQNFAYRHYQRLALDEARFQRALGESLTEPKPNVWFQGSMEDDLSTCLDRLRLWAQGGCAGGVLRLDAQTQMLFDAKQIFINAESVGASGAEAKILRLLANERALSPGALSPLMAVGARAGPGPKSVQTSKLQTPHKAPGLEARFEALLSLLAQWMLDGWLHLEG